MFRSFLNFIAAPNGRGASDATSRPRQNCVASRLSALTMFAVTIALMVSSGCATTTTVNSNANANTNINANANSNAPATADAPISAKEPESYSATITVNVQPTGETPRANIPPLQFDFAKRGADRRWSFQLPQIGQVVYLEQSGLKYLVLPSRSQYVEMTQETVGFQLPNLLTPGAIIDQLKSRTSYQNLGTETINGRTATKYRFAGQADTRTQAGTVAADSTVYVDESTGLPLRAEMDTSSTAGAGARVMIETRDIQMSPDSSIFQVPAGYKKVSKEEVNQQVQNFVTALRIVVDTLRQQMGGAPPSMPAQPATNANRAGANANR